MSLQQLIRRPTSTIIYFCFVTSDHISPSMAHTTLVGLKLIGAGGQFEREIVVTESITLFHLHRVTQFCLTPSQSDDRIAATPFTFKHGTNVLKAPKSTKLYRADSAKNDGCATGRSYTYQAGNGPTYTLTVTGSGGGDARYYVPRCTDGFGGNVNLNKINKKLLVRRFTGTGSGMKSPPKVFCDRRTPAADIMNSHLASMQEPLFPEPGTYYVFPAMPASF